MTTTPHTSPASTAISEQSAPRPIDVSIVIPLMNEQDNAVELFNEIHAMTQTQPLAYEVIFIDDGSTDATVPRLREAIAGHADVTLIVFTRNFGQTAAMAAGFRQARGTVIVPMDGDRQNDPADVPRLVAKLDEEPGWDIVSGWRKNRQDKLMSRRFPSIIANRIIKKMTWTNEIHDFGCSLKAYRKDVLDDVHLYGEMHRFLPAICKWRGARITEEVVHHRARVAGTSKYGLKRTIKVLLDLLTVKFLGDYMAKPIYFFGKMMMIMMLVMVLCFGIAVVQRFGILTGGDYQIKLNNNVLVLFSMMCFLMGVIFLMMGVISELLVRIYHESQQRTPYKIRKLYSGRGG